MPTVAAAAPMITPSDWVLIISIATATIVAMAGWAASYALNRRLQRKQLTIQILFQHRFDPVFTVAQTRLFKRLRTGTTIEYADFEGIIKNHKNNPDKQDPDDAQFCDDIKTVLNFYEFMAVAIMTKSIDGLVVWHDISAAMEYAFQRLLPAIEVTRDLYNDRTFFINFETLMNTWIKKPPSIHAGW